MHDDGLALLQAHELHGLRHARGLEHCVQAVVAALIAPVREFGHLFDFRMDQPPSLIDDIPLHFGLELGLPSAPLRQLLVQLHQVPSGHLLHLAAQLRQLTPSHHEPGFFAVFHWRALLFPLLLHHGLVPFMDTIHQLVTVVPGCCRYVEDPGVSTAPPQLLHKFREAFLHIRQVRLVHHNHLRLQHNLRAVILELLLDSLIVAQGILRVPVDDVEKRLAALDVAQESDAHAAASGCAVDQARHIHQREAAVHVSLPKAQVGLCGSEGVRGDLRLLVGDRMK
mmetsp:Transcript_1933/g.4601  ORF Transcript_1933/g.4601 Transcript_1933/m.4601 type:complete len:282 (+) Transcript_1933:175-1020(+)